MDFMIAKKKSIQWTITLGAALISGRPASDRGYNTASGKATEMNDIRGLLRNEDFTLILRKWVNHRLQNHQNFFLAELHRRRNLHPR